MCSYSYFSILLLTLSFMVSAGVALPIHCEYPCQPPSSRPLYGTPPPPSSSPPIQPVYGAPPPPPPPSGPVYESPTPPATPSCEPPPSPPASPLPTGPLYGYAVPPPPQLSGNCQPSLPNCGYPPPTTDVYQPVDSASHLPLNCLLILVLMLLSFLHF